MQVKILGAQGGVAQGCSATSFLIDGKLLIDAGSVASALSVKEQTQIEHILISHIHLDHVKDLAFLCDNCFGLKPTPFEVWTHPTVIRLLKAHLFNDALWPDFTKLPKVTKPTIRLNELYPETPVVMGDYKILAVKVKHAHDAQGFIIQSKKCSLLFTQDTGPTERIWEFAREFPNLAAIFTEVSFPNKMQAIANLSDHHTPQSLLKELEKMPQKIPVFLSHFKPALKVQILEEMEAMKEIHGLNHLHYVKEDGIQFSF
jgi:cAMP phosphodiesterase